MSDAQTPQTRKVFTITAEFILGPHKTSSGRLEAAFDAAVAAMSEAVQQQLLDGSLAGLKSSMAYSYRFMEKTVSTNGENDVHSLGEVVEVPIGGTGGGLDDQRQDDQ